MLGENDKGAIVDRLMQIVTAESREPHFTAEDVVREALKIVMRDQPDIADKIDKNALIERVRGKLDRAARESSGLKVESRPRFARARELVNSRQ